MRAAAPLSTLDRRLSLLELARAFGLERSIADPRIVLVTDRIDLGEQLKARSRLAALEPRRATTGRHLLDLVATEKRAVVTTLINKFDTAGSTVQVFLGGWPSKARPPGEAAGQSG